MKHLFLATLLTSSLAFADMSDLSKYLTDAVDSVEDARKDAVTALNIMVDKVDISKENSTKSDINTEENSISTQIVETHALGEIAISTADVEIAKSKAIATITRAIDSIEKASIQHKDSIQEKALEIIIQAVSSVEIAKANASKKIVEATQRVEISKIQAPKTLKYPEETLSIAKNIAAVQIAKSVADVEIAKSQSLIDITQSSMESLMPLSTENTKKLEEITDKAKENISSYISELEIIKTKVIDRISEQMKDINILDDEKNNTK